jgi:hypothetical protein
MIDASVVKVQGIHLKNVSSAVVVATAMVEHRPSWQKSFFHEKTVKTGEYISESSR